MKAKIDTSELIRIIKALKPFTRKPDKYQAIIMEYIYVEFNHETQEARFEALDGHRIAVEYVKCNTDESFSAFIKPFTPWKTDTMLAEIELINGIATVDMGYYSLKFIQPEGEWYETKKMISDTEAIKPSSKIGINPDYMIEALKNINSYGCKSTVIIETRDKKVPVIVREIKDKRNIRYILPVNIYDNEE
jgi:DNA polymerase III sliding clamp (beta) subunit (PCNA family)